MNKRLYNIWACMKQRCNNPKHTAAAWYHDKGIRVCDEWLEYKTFEKWALENGYSDDLTIDRVDSGKNYEPSNCRWITIEENRARSKVQKGTMRIRKIRYELWKCEDCFSGHPKKIELFGRYCLKSEAEEVRQELNRMIREENYKNAIERGENENILKRILTRETWMNCKYCIFKI